MVLIVDDDGCCASHTGHGSHIVVVVVAVSVVPSLLSFVVLLLLSSCTLRLIWRRKLFRSCSSAADAIAETRHITNRDESDLILFILLFFFAIVFAMVKMEARLLDISNSYLSKILVVQQRSKIAHKVPTIPILLSKLRGRLKVNCTILRERSMAAENKAYSERRSRETWNYHLSLQTCHMISWGTGQESDRC